jgi:hypothetical protein
MRTLLIVAGLFFSLCGALGLYLAAADPGREFDLKFVLPVDARQMPKPAAPPAVVSRPAEGERPALADGRAQEGVAPQPPDRPLFSFGDRPGAASEVSSKD